MSCANRLPPNSDMEWTSRHVACGPIAPELGGAQYIEHVNLGFPGSIALHFEDPQSCTGNSRFLPGWSDQLNTCFAQLIRKPAIGPRLSDVKRMIPRAG